jgi:renalase
MTGAAERTDAQARPLDVIVVGAGIAGLTAARTLAEAGVRLEVLEKSQGLGGRAATRHLHGTPADHGAQYFTARDPRWQEQVAVWRESGAVQVWSRGFHTLSPQGLREPAEGHPRYTFAGGMNTFGKLLADGLTVRRQARVTRLSRTRLSGTSMGWRVGLEDGSETRARRVLLNLPAPQALALGRGLCSARTEAALSAVTFAPCLALVAGYARAAPTWRGISVEDDTQALSWLACDSSKRAPVTEAPTEQAAETVLVLHGSPAFSERYLETPGEAVPQMLGVAALMGFSDPRWTELHGWRYAKVTDPYGAPYLKEDDTLFFCGDWCGGAKLEAAYLSGLEVAETMLV